MLVFEIGSSRHLVHIPLALAMSLFCLAEVRLFVLMHASQRFLRFVAPTGTCVPHAQTMLPMRGRIARESLQLLQNLLYCPFRLDSIGEPHALHLVGIRSKRRIVVRAALAVLWRILH